MKLNRLEFIAMNNPIREMVRERYEMKIMRSSTNRGHFNTVLEIGCGNGGGTRLIRKYFTPIRIEAIDFDEKMISIAKKRNKDFEVTFQRMDATKLDFPDSHFDAVFDFGIIHHISDWKACLMELKRVLKPEGELILADLSLDSFTTGTGKLWKIITDHPYESLYTPGEFVDYLKEIGFKITHYQETYPLKFVKYFFVNASLSHK